MKLGTVFTLNAIVAALFGLGFVLVPGALTSLYRLFRLIDFWPASVEFCT